MLNKWKIKCLHSTVYVIGAGHYEIVQAMLYNVVKKAIITSFNSIQLICIQKEVYHSAKAWEMFNL